MGAGRGANGISLVEAQQAYLRHGAKAVEDVSRVRGPRPDETRDPDWRPHVPADGELHPLHTGEEERASEARGREHAAAFQSEIEALRAEAGDLTNGELAGRVRELSQGLLLHYGDAEVELVSRLVRDNRWPHRHPVQAFAWAWRHRRSATLPARTSQLTSRPISE